ncbi:tellurite resistance TerB family protein [Elioraea thermophila]|uniref:tellurite resistance TerB family protein n=1 Tax=Elioraea thermophila TaxID=2185104 RepID=UPI000DF36075|nr:tellurite resistance TerB family protein [Elioraea thermophila]
MVEGVPLSPAEALVFAMVLVSAADRNMTDRELTTIGRIVTQAPAFEGFDTSGLSAIANRCVAVLDEEDGLDKALALIADALPKRLRETAYAFAVEVAAADGAAAQEELRVLELIRHRLEVDRLAAAAIERGARARHARL